MMTTIESYDPLWQLEYRRDPHAITSFTAGHRIDPRCMPST
jgi:hypothetical protein